MKEIIRPAFESVLTRYVKARTEAVFRKENPVRGAFEKAVEAIREHVGVKKPGSVIVRWSVGRGRWAMVPWIAALNTRETRKMDEGVYVIYLFRADMSGVYLTLNQGISGGNVGLLHARRSASVLRTRCTGLKDLGFTVDAGIDLRSKVHLVKGYESATVAYKLYERREVPSDTALLGDLANLLRTYEALIPSRRIVGVL